MAFSKLLVPVDGSRSSLQSLEVAATIARAWSSRVTVVHVVFASEAPSGLESAEARDYATAPDYGAISIKVEGDVGEAGAEAISHLDQRAESIIGGAQSVFAEHGVEVRTDIMRFREPTDAILDLADEGWYDLIIMGNGEDDHWELNTVGGVAAGVSRKFGKSVLIVKKKCGLSVISVLLEPGKEGLLDRAIEFAQTFGAKLGIIALEDEEGSGDRVLRSAIQQAADHGLEASGALVSHEERLKEILETVKEEGVETLLVPRPKVGGLGKLLHRGEWIYELLCSCPSSILLIA